MENKCIFLIMGTNKSVHNIAKSDWRAIKKSVPQRSTFESLLIIIYITIIKVKSSTMVGGLSNPRIIWMILTNMSKGHANLKPTVSHHKNCHNV